MAFNYYLDISTAHLTSNDNTLLNTNKDCLSTFFPLRVISHDYGYFVHVPHYQEEEEKQLIKEIQDFGMSNYFCKLIIYAKNNKCNWVNFDCDGETDENLQQFEW